MRLLDVFNYKVITNKWNKNESVINTRTIFLNLKNF